MSTPRAALLFLACMPGACRGPERELRPIEHRRTPEQRFFEWTALHAEREELAARRARLAERLRERGGGVFLAPAQAIQASTGTYRERDDFLYFTGIELPGALFALELESGSALLFAPDRDVRFENAARPNDYPGRLAGLDPELAELSGIAEILPPEALDEFAVRWNDEGRILWLDPGREGGLAEKPLALLELDDAESALARRLAAEQPGLRLADAHEEVARLRMLKSPSEIERLRRAAWITCDGIQVCAAAIEAGVTERSLAGEFEAACRARGAQGQAFDPIVKSGPNALWPWRILAAGYDRRDRVLEVGDVVILDVGCELDHYASDVGRTFPVSGRFSAEQRRAVELVTSVSASILAEVRPGVTLSDLQGVAERAIPEDARPYMQTGSFFGHHLGLDVGDPSVEDAPLEPGMVFTVEPWFYDHDRGIAAFIEDEVLVTEDGCEVLTGALPRDPDELEDLVGRRGRIGLGFGFFGVGFFGGGHHRGPDHDGPGSIVPIRPKSLSRSPLE